MGAGPAGMTAAVYAARKKLDTLVISGNVGGQTLLATGVETYYCSKRSYEICAKNLQHSSCIGKGRPGFSREGGEIG